jgi:hypothetical protein
VGARRGPTTNRRERPHRPHDDRLQQAALGIAAHGAESEEDREHGAEEEGREHRQPEDRRPGKSLRVEDVIFAAGEFACVAEDEVRADGVERQEGGGQSEDGDEDAPANALPHRERDHGHRRAQRRGRHPVSPPTASR